MAVELTKHYLRHKLASLVFVISVLDIAIGQTAVYMLGGNVELTCSSSTDDDIYIWTDDSVDPGLTIYVVDERSDQAKTGSAQNEQKYDNFGINNNYPGFVNLAIAPVEIEDEGYYECRFTNVASDSVTHQFHIEVPATVIIKNGSQEVESLTVIVGESYDITCTGTGGRSRNALSLEWQPPLDGGSLFNQSNGNHYTDYMVTSTYHPKKEDRRITCQLTGYIVQDELHDLVSDSVNLIIHYKPECSLAVVSTVGSDCRMVVLTCECAAVPGATAYFFYSGSSLMNSTVINSINVKVDYDTTSEFSCQASNDVGKGEKSNKENHLCEDEAIAPTREMSTQSDTNKNESPGTNAGLIVACSIVAVILVAVLVFVIVILIRRYQIGLRQETNKSYTKQVKARNDGTDNNAYMDLQEIGKDKNHDADALQIPERNVKLISILPGNGLLQYHMALITRAKGNQEGVVRTLSDGSTISVMKMFLSEVHNSKLGRNDNIVQLLGWCDTVPTYAIFEFVHGRDLSSHLKEEFSPHKVHTYGNTKKKSFQVPEKGNVDFLPKYALHVARGIQFLTRNKFLHPGLRAKKVLLDTTGNCKLYDFVSLENAKEWTRLIWNESVPYQWMPPEFLFLEAISSAGDIWSFGVLLWEIFTYGNDPYIGQTRSDVERKLRQKEHLHIPNNCPGAIWQLMLSCWQSSAEERPLIDDIASRLTSMSVQDKEYQEIR